MFKGLGAAKKISHYLRTVRLITGKWAIETKNYNSSLYYINVNLPNFNSKKQAEIWLSKNFEQI